MKVICIEEEAFYTLLDRVFEHIVSTKEQGVPSKWISYGRSDATTADKIEIHFTKIKG